MSWLIHHSKSEKLASEAAAASKMGDKDRALEYYCMAAKEEELALLSLTKEKMRTIGITAISAASLYFKGENFCKSEKIAHQYLAYEDLPLFAVNQLKTILKTIWSEIDFQKAGVKFVKGEVMVSVGGGIVVTGGAPLDLIHRKVEEVRNLFFRIIEMNLNIPFRKRGSPSSEIQEKFCPWLIQAPAGSYQFAIRIQKPAQMSLFPDGMPEVEEITHNFFEVINATAQENLEELERLVPTPDYRESFLRLTRNLAPTGKSFNKLEIKPIEDIDTNAIIFVPDSRKIINQNLKIIKKPFEDEPSLIKEQLVGILRGLELDKDWITVKTSEPYDRVVKIYETGDLIDDIVGPMVNQRVIVDAILKADGKYIFRDIQSFE
jgi:hypothetical protein